MIETVDLSISFGGHLAVDHVTCAFHNDALTAIVGPNGAGKTTYFNLLSGQLRPSSGKVVLAGHDVTRAGPAKRSKLGIARGFQLANLFPTLTLLENVRLAVQAHVRPHDDFTSLACRDTLVIDKARACLNTVGLLPRAEDFPTVLSHGGQRRLEFALLLAMERPIWLLDEPTAGMAAEEVPIILNLIRSIRADGARTILLVEHKMDVLRSLADRVVVLHNGRLVADGTPGEVMRADIVQEAYLGVGGKAAGRQQWA
ncbi:MAG: ABC transporter ATP-binding protein [Acetobacteraceae bacterium]